MPMCMSEDVFSDSSENEESEETSEGVTEVEQTGDDPNDPDSFTHTHYDHNPFGT